ncbi:hypothetical protein FXV77_14530 [Sphingobacterium phlebotomi]|uniref:Uncharacterized protein n=1 Tax=Sphingobacterium phlebotomi TaxID=2605433 RepID=A0A5D4H2F7_9SPHI|nr:hypothetical protein [Sphingobacterium phlebotomi]TYR34684.1 hypothetical protein FXV77_14530 [Sphingobacterium phlebotomi]
MKKTKQPWPYTLLLFVMMTLIGVAVIHLVRNFTTELEALLHETAGSFILWKSILLLGNSSLIVALLGIIYLLYAKVCGLPIPNKGPLSYVLDAPNLRQAFDFGVSLRNTYVVLIALPTTFYALFLQASTMVTLICSIAILLLIYLVKAHHNIKNGITTLAILILLLFCFNVKLTSLQNYSLLGDATPLVLSFCVSLLFAASMGIRHRRFYEIDKKKHPNESLMVPLTIMTAVLFCFYFQTVLLTINCHFAPRTGGENYRATVYAKCPIHDLHLKYKKNGKEKYAVIEVHPKLFHRVQEGDTIKLHLHSGRLGWPWYHDHISKRYYD